MNSVARGWLFRIVQGDSSARAAVAGALAHGLAGGTADPKDVDQLKAAIAGVLANGEVSQRICEEEIPAGSGWSMFAQVRLDLLYVGLRLSGSRPWTALHDEIHQRLELIECQLAADSEKLKVLSAVGTVVVPPTSGDPSPSGMLAVADQVVTRALERGQALANRGRQSGSDWVILCAKREDSAGGVPVGVTVLRFYPGERALLPESWSVLVLADGVSGDHLDQLSSELVTFHGAWAKVHKLKARWDGPARAPLLEILKIRDVAEGLHASPDHGVSPAASAKASMNRLEAPMMQLWALTIRLEQDTHTVAIQLGLLDRVRARWEAAAWRGPGAAGAEPAEPTASLEKLSEFARNLHDQLKADRDVAKSIGEEAEVLVTWNIAQFSRTLSVRGVQLASAAILVSLVATLLTFAALARDYADLTVNSGMAADTVRPTGIPPLGALGSTPVTEPTDPRTTQRPSALDREALYEWILRHHPSAGVPGPDDAIILLTDPKERRALQEAFAARFRARGEPEEWATVGVIADDRFMTLVRDAVRFRTSPPGALARYEDGLYVRLLKKPYGLPGVVALCVQGDRILLLRQFRHGARRELWGLPRGFAKAGESWEQSARREIQEESRGTIESVEVLARVYEDGSISDADPTLVFSRVRDAGRPFNDEGVVSSRWVTVEEALDMIDRGEIAEWYSRDAIRTAVERGLLKGPARPGP